MLPFTIERLIISGFGKADSEIDFSSGLTFVVGPSNTGKSHVMDGIDYLFGFSESTSSPFRFEQDWGYDKFTLVVKTPHGNVILTRKLGEKKIKVTGTDTRIQYLLDHQVSGQVIFIDQKEKMPTWLGKNSQCKYHEFTKSREHGRYGLLADVYDEE